MTKAAVRISLLLLIAPAIARAQAVPAPDVRLPIPRPELSYSLTTDATITGAAIAFWIGTEAFKSHLAPETCHWCNPPGFDSSVRDALRWNDTGAANTISYVVPLGVEPLVVFGLDALAARDQGRPGAAWVDALLISEATAIAMAMNQAVKFIVGRERPFVHALPEADKPNTAHPSDNNVSFYSGHATFAFALAASGGTIASMRGYRLAPWIWGAGMALAAATAYLRIAADRHYASDVTVGAILGSATGVARAAAVSWSAPRDGRARVARPWRHGAGCPGHFLTTTSRANQISERTAVVFGACRRPVIVASILPFAAAHMPAHMTRAGILAVLIVAGCYEQASNHAVPVTFVNDACGASSTQTACAAAAGCEWRPVTSDCPPGAACPAGVCATPDPCATLTARALCEADARCAWAGLRAASQAIDLCPAGQTCDAGGYCHRRDASGGGCTCVQPVVCPAGADCPAVQCDCSNPGPSGGGGGGGTCTCECPACAPGEACSPCTCACGAGGACGGVTSSGGGPTCTCACPSCAPGATCPPCDCACGAGNVGVAGMGASSGPPTTVGPAETPADPCAHHGDAGACAADSASACRWIELGIVCVTAPCPTGACVQRKAVAGGGCGCACAACAPGQSCPPCACDCCGQPTGLGPVPVPS